MQKKKDRNKSKGGHTKKLFRYGRKVRTYADGPVGIIFFIGRKGALVKMPGKDPRRIPLHKLQPASRHQPQPI